MCLAHRSARRERPIRRGARLRGYPAATLFQWGLRHKGYKGKENESRRLELFAALRVQAPWLDMSRLEFELLAGCDHAFDALIASLATRAAWMVITFRLAATELGLARMEGWIAVPRKGSLGELPVVVGESPT